MNVAIGSDGHRVDKDVWWEINIIIVSLKENT